MLCVHIYSLALAQQKGKVSDNEGEDDDDDKLQDGQKVYIFSSTACLTLLLGFSMGGKDKFRNQ